MESIDIFIPSYKRANNLKTAKYYMNLNWEHQKIHILVDDETPDIDEYRKFAEKNKLQLHVFNLNEARMLYDFIHRPGESIRAAGMARNMMYEIARSNGIEFYMVQDDDTNSYEIKKYGRYQRKAVENEVKSVFCAIEEFMKRHRIGVFGVSQSGDYIGGNTKKLYAQKVMNTTFYLTGFVIRGERGVQDNDTSLFCGVMNRGLFTGQLNDGLTLHQSKSATQKGGLTELYNELKLINKALVVPIQYPSAVVAERQVKNGNRLHHKIISKYLYPRIIKDCNGINNIAWDTYPEDIPFTNEAIIKRNYYGTTRN